MRAASRLPIAVIQSTNGPHPIAVAVDPKRPTASSRLQQGTRRRDLDRRLDPARLQGAGPVHEDRRRRAWPPCPTGWRSARRHPEFVRFVNGVLAKMRADGTWKAIYDRWLGGKLAPAASRRRLRPRPSTTLMRAEDIDRKPGPTCTSGASASRPTSSSWRSTPIAAARGNGWKANRPRAGRPRAPTLTELWRRHGLLEPCWHTGRRSCGGSRRTDELRSLLRRPLDRARRAPMSRCRARAARQLAGVAAVLADELLAGMSSGVRRGQDGAVEIGAAWEPLIPSSTTLADCSERGGRLAAELGEPPAPSSSPRPRQRWTPWALGHGGSAVGRTVRTRRAICARRVDSRRARDGGRAEARVRGADPARRARRSSGSAGNRRGGGPPAGAAGQDLWVSRHRRRPPASDAGDDSKGELARDRRARAARRLAGARARAGGLDQRHRRTLHDEASGAATPAALRSRRATSSARCSTPTR